MCWFGGDAPTMSDVETNAKRRKRCPEALKREIVAATRVTGASVSKVTRQYDVNANQVFTWRRRYRDAGEQPALQPPSSTPVPVPVTITPEPEEAAGAARRYRLGDDRDRVAGGVSCSGRLAFRWAGAEARPRRPEAAMIRLAVGLTDMRRGMNGISLQAQETLGRDPFVGDLFVFHGQRGDLIEILWHDGLGPCLSPYFRRICRIRSQVHGVEP
jgi:transposase-like protein